MDALRKSMQFFDQEEFRKIGDIAKSSYEDLAKLDALQGKKSDALQDKMIHCEHVALILEQLGLTKSEAHCFGWIHDIGRIEQFNLLNKFDDKKMKHHYLGLQFIENKLETGEFANNIEVKLVGQICTYHGRIDFMPYVEILPAYVRQLINLVSVADDLENGCLGAPSYLEREKDEDAKNFIQSNPDLDQTSVSEDVMGFFERGEKFNKLKYCHTYAEYFLFASVLAINMLKQSEYHDKAYNAMSKIPIGDMYPNAIEAYKQIFAKHIHPEISAHCIEVFEGYCDDPFYKYGLENIV